MSRLEAKPVVERLEAIILSILGFLGIAEDVHNRKPSSPGSHHPGFLLRIVRKVD